MANLMPPNGFLGAALQTMANRAIHGTGMRVTRRKKRRKASGKKRARTSSRKRTRKTKVARLVKGSAAAKRYMAKIRKLRK